MGICPLSVAVEGTDGSRAQAVVFGDGGNCFILGGSICIVGGGWGNDEFAHFCGKRRVMKGDIFP